MRVDRGGMRPAAPAWGALALCAALWLAPAQAADAAGSQAPAGGEIAPTAAADPELEKEVMELSHVLRCLVCQNQSIAESNAPLALDLRNQVREQLQAGRSREDVIDYLVERYGDFVLYEPPFKGTTLLLWLGPLALLIGGAAWLAYRLRRRSVELAADRGLSAADRERARALLERADEQDNASPESRS